MLLQQRLTLKLAQKPVLTQSLRQLVKLLALNKLELKEEIAQELVENPLLEATVDGDGAVDDASGQEEASMADEQSESGQSKSKDETAPLDETGEASSRTDSVAKEEASPSADDSGSDPFDEIDFHSFSTTTSMQATTLHSGSKSSRDLPLRPSLPSRQT